jgi:NTP pyrophosphatase (non-canonical NTP hydrolase)
MKTILDIIGAPAALEQCAEECSELAQACLKLARKLRGENPTPKDESVLYASLEEEIADVYLCLEIIKEYIRQINGDDEYTCESKLDIIARSKHSRWLERLEEK